MKKVGATEFKANLKYYFSLLKNEDILITKYGKEVALLTTPSSNKKAILKSLVGICEGLDDYDYRKARLSRQ